MPAPLYPIYIAFQEAIAFGQISGAYSDLAAGYLGTSATTTLVVRATAYTAQGANVQRSMKSTSALDTAAGTGARTVSATYLNTSMAAYLTETFTLNGTTAVNSANTDIAFLEKMATATCGSTGGNQGTLNIFTAITGGGSIWGSIAVQDNKTYWAHHYVLAGQTCYLTNLTAMATVEPGQVTLQTTGDPTSTTSPQLAVGSTYGYSSQLITGLVASSTIGLGQLEHDFRFPLAVVGPNFIFLNSKPVAASASTTYASFEFVQF